MNFETQVKLAVYRHFARTGEPPELGDVAGPLGCSREDVRGAYARLRADRVLLLEPDGEAIRMAPPFSGVPTQHVVEVGRRSYFANCAWDALGIPAALTRTASFARAARSRRTAGLEVGAAGPEPSAWLFHCLVPAAGGWISSSPETRCSSSGRKNR